MTEKIIPNADISILPVVGSGDMTSAVQYGKGSVLGFQFAAGGDYLLTKNIFVRASLRLERIGFPFDGTGKQSTMRDADPCRMSRARRTCTTAERLRSVTCIRW